MPRAEDAGEATRPSVKHRDAAPKPADGARESDAREAMCLMIEFGGAGLRTFRWNSSRA